MTVNAAATPTVSISLKAEPTTLSVGGTKTAVITATVTGGASGDTITWSNSDSTVVSLETTTATTVTADAGSKTYTNKVTALKNGKATITATLNHNDSTPSTSATAEVTVGGAYGSLSGSPSNSSTVYLDNWMSSYGTDYVNFQVTPTFYGDSGTTTTDYTVSYVWTLNGYTMQNSNVNPHLYTLLYSNTYLNYGGSINTLTCKATFTYGGKTYDAAISWNVSTSGENYLASVNVASSSSYYLSDRDDANGTSVLDQLSNRFSASTSGYYGLAYVQFLGTTHTYGSVNANTYTSYYPGSGSGTSYLGNVVFTPGSSAGKAIIPVRVYYYTYSGQATPGNWVDGNICFDTAGTAVSGDVNYSAITGDTVYFDASDFEDFYYSKSSNGTLSYVTFNIVSSGSGSLYADSSRVSSTTPCYASPTTRQTALDSVYFSPSGTTASKGGTVRIGFTAYGTRNTYTGTVVITYLNGAAKDITYTPTTSTINLKASDFTDAYKEVMGSNAPSDMTVQFQDAPANGSLSYKNSSSSSASTVNLRSSNIKSYRFTTRTSGANQLGDVTYTASGTKSDTIEYIAYAGGVARFTGKVVFNPANSAAATVLVSMNCTSAGSAFNLGAFSTANPTVLANTTQIRFVMPSHGTLTYSGTAVTNVGVTVPTSLISQLYYRPNAGYNGTDTVLFLCQDASGNQVGSGQVNIIITGNGANNATGVTSASQFTDVPKDGSANWYINELNYLISQGVVQGTSSTKVEPRGTLDYGQALKMVLVAAGYTQTEVPGSNEWAINYKNFAVSRGWIGSDITLTAPITRDATVELAAKVLGIAPVTDNSPFKDSNNGYAIALNRTNPQIIIGNANGTFNGSGTLLRQEVWMIVYRMMQYRSSQYSSKMPDGI